jgi:hypothetical protein
MTESSPIRGGAVSEDDPESTTKSPPPPPSDPGEPLDSPPRRRRSTSEEETSGSESGSALERQRKRKRVTGAGNVLPIADSASSGSDSSAYSSPLREPKVPLVTLRPCLFRPIPAGIGPESRLTAGIRLTRIQSRFNIIARSVKPDRY